MVVLMQSQPCPPLFENDIPHSTGSPTSIMVGLHYSVRCCARVEFARYMSELETAPAAPNEHATQVRRVQFAKERRCFGEKGGELFTQILLETADHGYDRVAELLNSCTRVSSGRHSGVWRRSWCCDVTRGQVSARW